jgi:ABC-2 type transport system permease protein
MSPLRRIGAVMRKEQWHIVRDRQTLVIILLMPLAMMFLYGYALTLDLRDVPVVVENPSASQFGATLARHIDATTMFALSALEPGVGDAGQYMARTGAKAIVRLPITIDADMHDGGTPAPIAVLIDGSDANSGTIIRNSLGALIQTVALDYLAIKPPEPVTLTLRVLYNPQQKSSFYFVPGLMAIILIMISALLTSLTITREKESGTLEQLLVSPLRPVEILLGKIIPYSLLAAADGVLVLLVGWLFFGVVVQGSIALLTLSSVVYIVTSLALGLIFSTAAKTQQQAMLMVLPATLLPSIVLSGFIFPLRSMPLPLQVLAHGVPATYYLQIIRAIILKGVGVEAVWLPLTILVVAGLIFMSLSVKLFGEKL